MNLKSRFSAGLIIFCGFFVPTICFSQGPPIFTDTPIMLGLEGGGIRTFGRFISKENVNVYVQPFAMPFNLTNKWQVGGIVPIVSKMPKASDSQFGLGDIKVFTKYQLIQRDGRGKTLRALLKIVETFPTGNTENAPWLGAGAWQTSFSIVSGFVTLKYGIYGEFGYNLTTNDLPDNFVYNLAFALPLLPQRYPPKQLNLSLELTGNYLTEVNLNTLLVGFGAQFIAGRRFLIESGIQIPLIEDAPAGSQTNFIFTLGTRVLLF